MLEGQTRFAAVVEASLSTCDLVMRQTAAASISTAPAEWTLWPASWNRNRKSKQDGDLPSLAVYWDCSDGVRSANQAPQGGKFVLFVVSPLNNMVRGILLRKKDWAVTLGTGWLRAGCPC